MQIRIFVSFIFLLFLTQLHAQLRQSTDMSSYRSLIPVEKQELLKNIDIIANMQMGFRSDFRDGQNVISKFQIEQFRLEIKGYVHEKVFFRFRHRYTSDFEPQSIDKIIKGVDFAYVRIDFSDRWQMTIGKTYADWGGIEFDLNPIDVYEYSDIIENADNFLTGVGIYFQAMDNHGFSAQILNSRTGSFEELYDSIPTVVSSKAALAGVLNWRGKFWGGKFTTLWSYSLFNEAKGVYKNYIALGNQLKLDRLVLAYDFKISNEDLDRTSVISTEVPDDIYNYALPNTLYYSHWLKADYTFADKWHACFTGFIDNAKWQSDVDPTKNTNDWRKAYGFIPTIEYYPWDDFSFKFYAGYVGRVYTYSDYAKERAGLSNYNTGRLIIGLTSPLHIL